MPTRRYAFPSISVAGRPHVEICVDLDAGDEVTPWLLEHDWIDEPVQRAFLDHVRAGERVIDLGSHLGVFSLPAAAAGAHVLAVDAAPRHIEQVSLAAFRGGFAERYHPVWGAFTDAEHSIAFIENSIHGHVLSPSDPEWANTIEVPSVTIDDLLDELGWEQVDVIKMDIEGGELPALRGMTRLFARGCRPTIVFESNGAMLPLYGASTHDLRSRLVDLGYELLQIDHLRPGILVETGPEDVQPDCVADYLALAPGGPELADNWSIETPRSADALALRLADEGAKDAAPFRSYIAAVIHDGPGWLRAHPVIASLDRALRIDCEPAVVAAACHGALPPAAVADAAPPAGEAGEVPGQSLLVCDLVLRAPDEELERPPGWEQPKRLSRPALSLSFHAADGQLVGIVGPSAATTLALQGLSGEVAAESGTRQIRGRVLNLLRVAEGCEPGLSAEENVQLLTIHFGGDAAAVDVAEICADAGFAADDAEPVAAAGPAAITGLVLLTAIAQPLFDVMLIGEIPPLLNAVAVRVAERLLRRRHEDGLTVVQALPVPAGALHPPDRLAWLTPDGTTAAGHPESVSRAFWRSRLGLPVSPAPLEAARPLGWRA